MKIQLIFPPIDETYGGNTLTAWRSPPSGLAQLAKAAEFSGIPKKDIQILDGVVNPLDYILDNLNSGLVGITSWFSNARNTRTIAKAAKEKGAYVVVGGHDVNNVTAQRMIDNNGFIDSTVIGKGVSFMPFLVKTADLEKLFDDTPPVKVAWSGKDFSEPWEKSMLFDLEHLDWTKYPLETTQIAIDGIRGCMKAEKLERCDYCSITDRLSVRGPRQVWEQVALINSMYGFDYFFETGDTIMVGNYPERLLATRPKGLEHIRWRVYTAANEVTPESIELFRKLNVAQLYIGLESLDNDVLSQNNRSNTAEDNERAVALATKGPWELHLSILYGLPGESEASMKKNYDFFRKARDEQGEKMFILSGPALPLAGSELFNKLSQHPYVQKHYHGDLQRDDIFNYEQLLRLHTELFTETTYDRVQHYVEKTGNLIGRDRAPGFGVNK